MKDNDGLLKDLPVDTEEKDLGVKFHSSMKFESHISSVVNKTNQLIGLIKRSFSFMDKELFLKLYKTLVRTHADYGTLYGTQSQRKINKLLKIYNVERPKLCQRSKTYHLQTLEYRMRSGDLIQMIKILHDIDHIDSSKFFLH